MKIGLITFHRAHNLGAVLQAYALDQYLNETVGSAEIIDFVPNNQVPLNCGLIKKILRLGKAVLCYPLRSKERKFNRFIQQKYHLSQKTYFGDADMKQNPPKYDLLISGSDQIFNMTLSGNSESYYLSFDDQTMKISYASSFGRTALTDLEHQLIQKELPKFSAVSVREQSGVDLIAEKTGIQAKLVADPVFLLSAEEWDALAVPMRLPKKYIFVYAMEVNATIQKTVSEAREKYGLPVFVVYGCKKGGIIGKTISDCGPQEFLSGIRNAELVITNSFHGTAFSIIFKKKYVCIAHSSRNTRLENLLSLINHKQDQILLSESCEDLNKKIIDGKDAYFQMHNIIFESKKFLLQQ